MKLLRKRRNRRIFGTLAVEIQVVLVLIVVLLPIIWLVSESFKNVNEMFSTTPTLIPKSPTFENYIKIWRDIPYATYLKNSLIIALYTSIVTLVFASLAAYSFSRFKYRGRGFIRWLMLVSQMFPAILLIIPIFIYANKLGLGGRYTGVVIAYQTFLLPFCSWTLTNFLNSIPKELDEAGYIDGCTHFQVLWKILLPVSLPGIISIATYSFLGSWNEFIFTMTLMQNNNMWTVPVGLNALSGQYGVDWGLLTAGGVVCLVPAVLVMLFLQKFLVKGLMAGSVKG